MRSVQPEYWQKDEEAPACTSCQRSFSWFFRRHHCRNCGFIFCNDCTSKTCAIPLRGITNEVRVCLNCFNRIQLATRPTPAAPKPQGSHKAPAATTASAMASSSSSPALVELYRGVDSPLTPGQPLPAFSPVDRSDLSSSTTRPSLPHPIPSLTELRQVELDADSSNGESERSTAHADDASAVDRNSPPMEPETVNYDSHFIDIVVQKAHKVDRHSVVEFNMETDGLVLTNDIPIADFLLPLKNVNTNTVGVLMEPVKPATLVLQPSDPVLERLAERVAVASLVPTSMPIASSVIYREV